MPSKPPGCGSRRCRRRTSRSCGGSTPARSTSSKRSIRMGSRQLGRPWSRSCIHDFETVTVPGQVPLPGVSADPSRPIVYGLDGFVNAFRDWLSAWDTWVVTAPDFIDVDENRVLALFDVRARSKTHQVEMPIEGATLTTVTDGRIARLELFFDREQALEAAGLSE